MKEIFKKYGKLIAIGAWILAAISFLHIFFPSNTNSRLMQTNNLEIDTSIIAESKYELYNNYGDPFLRSIPNQNKSRVHSERIAKPTALQPKRAPKAEKKDAKAEEKKWPVVIYSGCIVSHQDKSELGLYTVNGKQVLAKEKEAGVEFTVLEIHQDSSLLEMANLGKKWIYIKK